MGWDAGDRTVILIDMEKLVEETLSKYDFTYLEKYLAYGQKYRTGIWDMNADFDASLDMTGLLLGSTAESAPITLDGTLEGVMAGGAKMDAAMGLTMDLRPFLKALTDGQNGGMSASDTELLDALAEEGIHMELRGDLEAGQLYISLGGAFLEQAGGLPADTWYSMDMSAIYEDMGLDYGALMEMTTGDVDYTALLSLLVSTVEPNDKDTAYSELTQAVDLAAQLLRDDAWAVSGNDRILHYALEQDGVAADFGMDAPEYRAAELYFSQSPRPAQLCVGRWGKTPTPAILKGGILSDGEADASAWASVKDGSFAVSVGGVSKDITGLDFSGVTNMNGVAAVVSAALASAGASCAWDGQRFAMKTSTLGASAGIGYLAPLSEPAGTDISAMLRMTASTGLPPVAGTDGETAKEAVAALADKSGDWYGCVFADEGLAVEDHLDVAAFVEASAKARIYGVTVTDSRALDAGYAEDAASKLKELARKRTIVAYSRNPYAIVSALGRAFTVNFSANRSTITLKFKQLPGVVAEGLTETQAQALEAKRCNVFAAYDNDTAIFQEGVMSGPAYFDEIHGLDWLQNAIQSETWNLLYQSKAKIPQTDAGANQIITCIEAVLGEAVNNGLVAPGTWNADGFGLLERGDYLDKGYYVYTTPVAEQAQSEREQRKCPPIQIAAKLAGAIHFVDVQIDVNR